MDAQPDPLAALKAFPFPPPDDGILSLEEPPEALLALLLSDWARRATGGLLHLARSTTRADRLARAAASFAPDVEVLALPPWDCSPYDRASPSRAVMGARMSTLARLLAQDQAPARLVITTVGSLLQRVPPRAALPRARFELAPGRAVDDLRLWLIASGYVLDERVDEPGEAAFRGEVIEIFPSEGGGPVRIEHAEGTIRRMRCYDPVDQRTTSDVDRLGLHPASEVLLDRAAVASFLAGEEGAPTGGILVGGPERPRRASGIEHRLPSFYERLETVFDFLPGAVVALDPGVDERVADWLGELGDAHATRSAVRNNGGDHVASLDPRLLYLEEGEWREWLGKRPVVVFSVANGGNGSDGLPVVAESADPGLEVARFVRASAEGGGRVVLAAHDPAVRRRFARLVERRTGVDVGGLVRWEDVAALPGGTVVAADLDLQKGFARDGLAVVAAEQAGVRHADRRARSPAALRVESEELRPGDLVVHAEHGVARLRGLEPQGGDGGAPCEEFLSLEFAGERKLLVPALDVAQVWRNGSEVTDVPLDRLGGDAWQARRAEVEAELEAAARELLARARERARASGPQLRAPKAAYRRFVARFPFSETEDQTRAIDAALGDLARGAPPMDRLICGDVGFGKTEVALRAACAAALAGKQVAVVAPTTVLVRQHCLTFRRRFAGFDLRVDQLSRLSGGAEARAVRAGLADGSVRIVVGTHTLASEQVRFADLGLVIVDEEQRFGTPPQGAAEKAARRGAPPDPDRDPDPSHAAGGAGRAQRHQRDRRPPGAPAAGAHLRHAVRSRSRGRGPAARGPARWPELLRLPADQGPRADGGTPVAPRPGARRGARPWADEGRGSG